MLFIHGNLLDGSKATLRPVLVGPAVNVVVELVDSEKFGQLLCVRKRDSGADHAAKLYIIGAVEEGRSAPSIPKVDNHLGVSRGGGQSEKCRVILSIM